MKLALFMTAGMSLARWEKGGILSREIRLYNELAKHFDKIYLVTYGGKEELEYKGLLAENIEILYDSWCLGGILYSLLAPLIHREKLRGVDFLKTNQMAGAWTVVIAKILFGSRLIIRQGYPWSATLREKRSNPVKLFLAIFTEKIAYRNADRIIVTTNHDKMRIIREYGIREDKISVVPNYVDIDVFKPSSKTSEFRRRGTRLVYIGRLSAEKNLMNLIDAVKSIDVELFIVGDGAQGKELREKVRREHIHNVYFFGVVKHGQLPALLNTADIFVLPSYYEGNPKALLEAMACGLPIIASNVRGINTIVELGYNGYLCGLSQSSIREAIQKMVVSDGVGEMGRVSRETAVRNYSLDVVIGRELGVYS